VNQGQAVGIAIIKDLEMVIDDLGAMMGEPVGLGAGASAREAEVACVPKAAQVLSRAATAICIAEGHQLAEITNSTEFAFQCIAKAAMSLARIASEGAPAGPPPHRNPQVPFPFGKPIGFAC
jgi:hypothetical protein